MRTRVWYTCNECGFTTERVGFHQRKTGHLGKTPVRWDTPGDYRAVHRLLHTVLGAARERMCECGKPAEQWSLAAELHQFGQNAWSSNLDDYDPLCQTCHKKRDWPDNERRAAARRASQIAGRRGGEALKRKREEDPELDARIMETIRANGAKMGAKNGVHHRSSVVK